MVVRVGIIKVKGYDTISAMVSMVGRGFGI